MTSEETIQKPLCFVLMPFGSKPDPTSVIINFDEVYRQLIKPAIEQAGMEPIRADEEELGGIIHKPMFERLILCDYAVADLTTANANVFYELGVRHGIRPQTTVSVFAEGTRLPFDLSYLRSVPYSLDKGIPDDLAKDVSAISDAISAARADAPDSPVFQLVKDLPSTDISHLKTDVFRERVAYNEKAKKRLSDARKDGADAVRQVHDGMGPITDLEAGLAVDLLLSYRAVGAHDEMDRLVNQLPEPLRRSVLVREQHAFALNRLGRSEEAERLLLDLIADSGPSSETYGLLGRVYKDRWEEATELEAPGHLRKAIDAYRKGFEADWRDSYPGVNAVTLMELAQPPDERREQLLPVVLYSTQRRIESGTPDYWDHATLLELAVLRNEQSVISTHAGDALASTAEYWQPETTARNLNLIRKARDDRGEDTTWFVPIIETLEAKAAEMKPEDE